MELMIVRADAWSLEPESCVPIDQSEAVVAHAFKAMARIMLNSAKIKIHR